MRTLEDFEEGEKDLRCSTKGKYQFYVVKICYKFLRRVKRRTNPHLINLTRALSVI